MTEVNDKKSFWETLPGVLTGVAAVITAVGGVLALFIRPGLNSTKETNSLSTVDSASLNNTKPTSEVELSVAKKSSRRSRSTVQDVNVAGVWRDAILGNEVHFSQEGDRISTKTIFPATGQMLAVGNGRIEGRAINGSYRWYDGTNYQATLNVSEDQMDITGSYQNLASGESGVVHLVR